MFEFCIFVILLLVIIYYFYQKNATERFSPYESTQAHDMPRSDPAFDIPSANPPGRSSEDFLFDQTSGWIANTEK
jgi:hypothetical protein